MANQKMRILNPVGEPAAWTVGLAPRPPDLEGKRLVIFDNAAEPLRPMEVMPNYLLKFISEELGRRHRLKGTRWVRKPIPSAPTPELLDEVTQEADVVLNGVAR